MWTRSKTILSTWCARLMTQLAAFEMIAADFTRFCAERTECIVMTWSFAAMTAGCVWPFTLSVTNFMYLLNNNTVNSDIAISASMCAVVFTSQCYFTGCWTGVINIQRQFMTMNLNFMFAMLHDLFYLNLTVNFLWYLRLMTSQLFDDVFAW